MGVVLNWFPALTTRNPRQTTSVRAFTLALCITTALYFFYIVIAQINPRLGGKRAEMEQDDIPAKEIRAMRIAENRTLGFSSIKFINMPTRYDRLDSMTIQSYLAGIDFDIVPAVPVEQIKEVGMPPSSRPVLSPGEKGCWRAHANVGV
jgi:hypothetical protein